MNKDYQMTTVLKYVEILDEDLSFKEKKIRDSVLRYITRMKKSDANAVFLEKLLAS
jgi:hypothetical protein